MSSEKIIETRNLSKHFGSVKAVQSVSLDVRKGEVLALVGDNGAGKSTMIKMLCGVLQPTDGEIVLRGEETSFSNYNDARQAGIETVYQDLALARAQSVAANVFLGHEAVRDDLLGRLFGFVDEEHMMREAEKALDRVNIPIDPEAKVRNLSGGQQQAVAIARALQSNPDILIMDEPTSALSIEGVRNVLRVVDDLRSQGITIILISHNIRQVLATADRISVLAQGRLMGTRDAEETDREEIVSMMMGVEDGEEILDLGDEGDETAVADGGEVA
ncbi:ATP-binding cassette domain-containing protein [Salinigranum salinum]|uniref:ATP-binding cassette domain-containing protein n=1 Tax=Salinigranum salinum TaxID=1364937 RepID=UPI0012608A2B|nr:ATP-binding cassette domain-containing protein [Salinigranum salinum]